MQILVIGKEIKAIAPKITFGKYDEPFDKWRMADENDNLLYYALDNGHVLVENVTLPNDYEESKYFFENGEFVLNPNWHPPLPSDAERIARLEEIVAVQEEQLIATDEITIGLYEAQIAQEEINLAYDESIIELYELYGSLQ